MEGFLTYAQLQRMANKASGINMTPEQIEHAKMFIQFALEQTERLINNSQGIDWQKMKLLMGRAEILMYSLPDKTVVQN